MTKKPYFLLLSLGLLFACGGSSHDEAMMKEAHELQEEIIEMLSAIEESLDSQLISKQDSLKEIIEEMEENLFEIPGYHLELPGHEGHDHGHARVNLTDQEILDVHKEMHKEVKTLQNALR